MWQHVNITAIKIAVEDLPNHNSVYLLGISGSPQEASTVFVIKEAKCATKRSKAKTDCFFLKRQEH